MVNNRAEGMRLFRMNISAEHWDKIQTLRKAINQTTGVRVHYPQGVSLAHAIRVALVIGLDASKDRSVDDLDPKALRGKEPVSVSLPAPLWLLEKAQELADKENLSSVDERVYRADVLRWFIEIGFE